MEILFLLLLFGFLGKGATKAVLGGGKGREERREPTGIILAMSRKHGCMIIQNSQVLSKNGNE